MAGELFVVGLSWRTAPVAVREKLAFRDEELPNALDELLSCPDISEAVVVSTCNRVEIFGAIPATAPTSALAAATAEARGFLSRSRHVSAESLSNCLYEHSENEATGHIFRVASALDSLVVGETQILGQVKSAYGVSMNAGVIGGTLGRCLERAFSVAKRVRTETAISRGAANVSSVSVELARHVFGSLDGKTVLVVGAGKMSALAARHLHADGASSIMVTNRSLEKAEALADEVDGLAKPWEQLQSHLVLADVVISSTAASQPVLTKKLIKKVNKKRRYRPLVIVDIAVPRDAEEAVGKLDGVYLFDIDDLERVVASNLSERKKEANAALRIVDAEVEKFRHWQRTQKVVPTIRSLRKHFQGVAASEVDKVLAELKKNDSPEQQEKLVRRLGEVIVNKLLHLPMTALRSGDDPEIERLVAAAERLFSLSEDEQADDDAA